jgi:thymidylate synthase (FAD)
VEATLIATTQFHGPPVASRWRPAGWDTRNAQHLIEFAGRACYESWERPNPKTADNDAYVRHIVEVGHFSVLEHASASFYVTGISRSLTHEHIRHRHFSYSQRSQRYVNEAESGWVAPVDADPGERLMIASAVNIALTTYRHLYTSARARGLSVKRARGLARSVLPNATETNLVVTGNLRAWRDFIKARTVEDVEPEISALAVNILAQLTRIYPDVFGDMNG